MTDLSKTEAEEARRKVIRQRNLALALVLTGFVVLFFVLTIVKFPV